MGFFLHSQINSLFCLRPYFYSFIYDETSFMTQSILFQCLLYYLSKMVPRNAQHYACCLQPSVRGMTISNVWDVLGSWVEFSKWKGSNREGLLTSHSYIPCAQLTDCVRGDGQWWGSLFVILPEAKVVDSQWHSVITLTLFGSQIFGTSLMWTSNHNFIIFFAALRGKSLIL